MSATSACKEPPCRCITAVTIIREGEGPKTFRRHIPRNANENVQFKIQWPYLIFFMFVSSDSLKCIHKYNIDTKIYGLTELLIKNKHNIVNTEISY